MLHHILYMRVIIQCVKYKSTLILTTPCILFSYKARCASLDTRHLWTCAVHISDITLLYYTHRAEPKAALVCHNEIAVEVESTRVTFTQMPSTREERENLLCKDRARPMPGVNYTFRSTSFCYSISKYFI